MIDATNVQPEARKTLIALAREYHVFAVAIVFDLPERLCQNPQRDAARPASSGRMWFAISCSSCGDL